jgi:hypothetical protein
MLAWLQHALHTFGASPFAAIARHTGVPAVVVAAIALVLSFRLARRMARLFVEVGLALAVLLTLTSLGWIRW